MSAVSAHVAEEERASVQALRVIGTVVAPATLVTALLLWFGNLHAQALFRYLRVPFTLFELTPQDYLLRGVDGLLLPMAVSAGAVAILGWARKLVAAVLPDVSGRRAERLVALLAAVVGVALGGYAVFAFVVGDVALAAFPEGGGLALAAAAVLLSWSGRALRRAPTAFVVEWCAVLVLVGVGLFWSVTSYAIGVGGTRGAQIAAGLGAAPDVVLYTERRLNLAQSGVREIACSDTEAAYAFRYEGLKLVMRSGDQYLFLPDGWTREAGSALVLPRSDEQRLEFTGAGTSTPAVSC